jgi:hypothetical protein
MKTTALIVAITALASPACAHDFGSDLMCKVTGRTGNQSIWSFANNSHNIDGSEGGTFVETGYSGNGRETYSPPGRRPIWIFSPNNFGGFTLLSRDAPGWSIVVFAVRQSDGYLTGEADLTHNGRVIGSGNCARQSAPDANGIGDVAPE